MLPQRAKPSSADLYVSGREDRLDRLLELEGDRIAGQCDKWRRHPRGRRAPAASIASQSWSEGAYDTPTISPSLDRSRDTVWPQGSWRAGCSSSKPARSSSSPAAVTASASSTSNSTLACGTVSSAGHDGVPKHASAAWDSGQTPKCLLPAIFSLCQYSPPSPAASGRPRAST